MAVVLTITESQIFTALGNVLDTFGFASSQSGGAVPIVQGQVNRVPEPTEPDYAVMWPLTRSRLAMNIDEYFDNQFTGSITSNVLTVAAVLVGAVAPGQILYGAGVTSGCQVTAQLTGPPGGAGTYSITPSAPVTSETIYCGIKSVTQETDFGVQLDIHGPLSGDNATRCAALFRDQSAIDAFQDEGAIAAPIWASEPRQMPFVNGEQQYEGRWTIDLHLQVNIAVLVTQQFADHLIATVIQVETLA